jgi:hypothetical protein
VHQSYRCHHAGERTIEESGLSRRDRLQPDGDLATGDFGDANVIRKFGQAAKAVTNACSSGAASPFLPAIQDPFDKAQDQIAPSRLSARFLIHELLRLRLRGSERLCFLPKVRHEAAELVPRLRLCMRTEFCVLPELRHPRR